MNSIDFDTKNSWQKAEPKSSKLQTLHYLEEPAVQNDYQSQKFPEKKLMDQFLSGNQMSTKNFQCNQLNQTDSSQSDKTIPFNQAVSMEDQQSCQFHFNTNMGKLLSESIQRKNENNAILEKQNEEKFLKPQIFNEFDKIDKIPPQFRNQLHSQNLHKFVITKQIQQQQALSMHFNQVSSHSQNQLPPNFPLYSYPPNLQLTSSSEILTKFEEEQKQSQLTSDKYLSSDWLQNIINPEQQENESSRIPSLLNMNEVEGEKPEEKNNNNNNNSSSNVNFNAFAQNVLLLVQEQSGCRLLQKELDKKDPQQVTNIFSQVILILNSVIMDQYGNYLCQKLAETCSASQFLLMLQTVKPNFTPIAINQYGTRAIQKFIEIITTVYSPYSTQNSHLNAQQFQNQLSFYYLMLNEISQGMLYNFVILSQDSNGNHVICKCLQNLSNEDKQFLYNEAMSKFLQISMNKHGCCTMQRFFDFGSQEQKNQLLQVVLSNLLYLIEDQFGNYVIQYILDQPNYDEYKN